MNENLVQTFAVRAMQVQYMGIQGRSRRSGFNRTTFSLTRGLPGVANYSAIAGRTPTQRPEAHRYHVETCEMAANSAIKLFRESSFQQLSFLTSER